MVATGSGRARTDAVVRSRGLRGTLAGALVAASALVAVPVSVVAVDAAVAPPAAAVPGSPGVMEMPQFIRVENFENFGTATASTNVDSDWSNLPSGYVQTLTEYPYGAAPGSAGYQPAYVSADGTTYTADQQWAAGTSCNGIVIRSGASVPARAATGETTTGTNVLPPTARPGCNRGATNQPWLVWFNAERLLANDMGTYALSLGYPYASIRSTIGITASAADNHVVTSYTNGTTAVGTMLQTATPFPATVGNYYQFTVDIGSQSCFLGGTVVGAQPQFNITQAGGQQVSAFSQAINTCTRGKAGQQTFGPGASAPDGSRQQQRTSLVATYIGDVAVRATGTTLGLQVRNNQASGNGNDTAFDNVVMLDSTPKLDKVFSTGPLTDGAYGTNAPGTLTWTVTNTYDPTDPTQDSGPKNGWSFTDALPAGLRVLHPSAYTTTCNGGTLSVTGGTVRAGGNLSGGVGSATEESCTFSVQVTSDTPGTYTNTPADVTTDGLLPPGSTSITFVDQPPVGCTPDALLFQQQPTVGYSVDLVTGASTPLPGFFYSPAVNSLGVNALDGYVYGFDNSSQSVVRIAGDGSTVNLGKPSAFPTTGPVATTDQWNVGDVDPQGHLWIAAGNTGTTTAYWMEIDVDATSSTYLQVLGSGSLTKPANMGQFSDWSFYGGSLYTVGTRSGGTANQWTVAQFDLSTHLLTDLGNTPALVAPNGAGSGATTGAKAFGATYTDSGGRLFASSNTSGQIWRFDLTSATPAATGAFFAYGPASSANDGARCLEPPVAVDLGDAPASYGTTLAADGARHGIVDYDAAAHAAPLMIGATVDDEADGVPSAGADGDDLGVTDDEDGTASPISAVAGRALPVALTVTNDSDQDATLAGWVDLNRNGTFDAGERQLTTVPAGSGAQSYTLTFGTASAGAQTYARFRLYTGTVTAPSPTGAVDGGEVEDYPVVVGVPGLEISKTSDAGASVVPGQTITYTVTVTNTGTVAYTDSIPATFTDDLSGVADDADYGDDEASDAGGRFRLTPLAGGPATTGLTWTGALAVGATARITYSVTVHVPADGDGTLANAVTGPPESNCPAGTEDDCTTSVPVRALTITKSVTPASGIGPGDALTYTVTVENSGAYSYTAADPATISDDLADVLAHGTLTSGPTVTPDVGTADVSGTSLTWSGPLEAGASVTLTYVLTTADPLTGDESVENSVTGPPESSCATGDEDGCGTSVPVLTPGLEVTKTSDAGTSVVAGQTVTYTVTVENTGETDYTAARPATVTDDLSDVTDDATFSGDQASDAGGSFTTTGTDPVTGLTWTGPLVVGQIATLTYSVVVDDPPGGDGTLTNAVTAPESACVDGTEPACTTSVPVRALEIEKSATPAVVDAGGTVTYTVTVTNTGQVAYTDDDPAAVTDDLTGVTDDADYSGDAASDAGGTFTTTGTDPVTALTWSGALGPGQTVTLTYSVTVHSPPDGDGTLVNTVTGPPESTCVDGTEPGCSTSTPVRALTITKAAPDLADAAIGDAVQYTVTATNTGQAAYTGLTPAVVVDDLTGVLDDATYGNDAVTDPVLTGTLTYAAPRLVWSGPLAVGASVTLTYSVIVTGAGDTVLSNVAFQPPPDAGCTDAASCDVTPPEQCVDGTDPATGLTCDDVVVELPRLAVTKAAPDLVGARIGDTVTYTVTATNTGAGDYTSVAPATVVDDLTGVLDDATYAGDAAAAPADAGELGYSAPRLVWTGPLAAGASVTITYSVTLTGDGDTSVDNVAFQPPSGCTSADDCDVDPPQTCTDGTDPETGLPCDQVHADLPRLTIDKSAPDLATARVGDTVTYTVTAANTGAGAFTTTDPATVVDDLTDVLDDATYAADAAAAPDTGALSYTAPRLVWIGPLDAGGTVTITYSVTLTGAGDMTVANVAFQPPPDADCTAAADCDAEPPQTCTDGTDPATGLACDDVTAELPHLAITKSSPDLEGAHVGDTVSYTVTATNDGPGDWTADRPATVVDDLSALLDDATYGGDAVATPGTGTLTYAEPRLVWTGPLASGASVSITYTVTLTGSGEVRNVAFQPPPDEGCTSADDCDVQPPESCTGGIDPDTGLPCAIVDGGAPQLAVSKTSPDLTAARIGSSVTYTVTATNVGAGAYTAADPATVVDDLTGILDDATWADDATATRTAPAGNGNLTFAAPRLVWSGALAAGASVTITYSAVVTGDGDLTLDNVAFVPPSGCATADDCDVVPPAVCTDGTDPETGLACDDVSQDLPRMTITKSSPDVATARVGDTVHYTVVATNTGPGDYTAAAPAVVVDYLGRLLDDATYGGDATATVAAGSGALGYASPRLVWIGSLPSGAAVTITYSMTVTGQGDGDLDNVAHEPPPDAGCRAASLCDVQPPAEGTCVDGFDPQGLPCGEVTAGLPALDIVKSSPDLAAAEVGDTVHYSVTATNIGTADFDDTRRATVVDDLTGVLDDGTYGDDATATTSSPADVGTVGYAAPRLVWTGTLTQGESVTLEYSVTLTAGGDLDVDNIAFEPSGTCTSADDCDVQPPDRCVAPADLAVGALGRVATVAPTGVRAFVGGVGDVDPETGLPCWRLDGELPTLVLTKTATPASFVRVGDVVTFTVTATNTGPGDYTPQRPAVVVDDLTDVLDDATYGDDAQASPAVGDLTYGAPRLVWTGPLTSGDSVALTYSVTIEQGGDATATNIAFQPPPDRCGTGTCDVDPPDSCVDGSDPATGLPCAQVEVPVGPPSPSPTPTPTDEPTAQPTAEPTSSPVPPLATTGSDSRTIGSVGAAALVALLAGTALAAAVRRRRG